MKKLAWFILLALTLSLFAGCQKDTRYTPNIPKSDLQSIEKAYSQQFSKDAIWFNKETSSGNLLYCGSYNGFYILIDNVPDLSSTPATYQSKSFGDEVVLNWVNENTQYYAFKDGTFVSLEVAYESGLVSKTAMQNITNSYNLIFATMY